jgi:hypothetical protein
MQTLLGAAIPKKHPYGAAPWNYTGTDSVLAVPAGVIDWVLVTLRSGTAANTGVDTVAAFIMKSGAIVGLDGSSPLFFPGVKYGNYYVVLRHRNHLAIMTKNTLVLNRASAQYDFTTAQDKAYGTSPMLQVGSKFCLYTGDANLDGQITTGDFTAWLVNAKAALTGYTLTDFNCDAQNSAGDFSLWLANAKSAATSKVP